MFLTINPQNPGRYHIQKVVETLRDGGVIIYPTDTVYGLGCDIFKTKSIERIARIKGVKVENSNFSIICHDFSHLSQFTKHINNSTFKMVKRHLPGPFTFIFEANSNLPRLFKNKKRTIGIRIPNHNIPLDIVRELGNPILTTSIHDSDTIIDYTTDPDLIHENMGHLVDLVIDGGYGRNVPSTVVDCTSDIPVILRQGLGVLVD